MSRIFILYVIIVFHNKAHDKHLQPLVLLCFFCITAMWLKFADASGLYQGVRFYVSCSFHPDSFSGPTHTIILIFKFASQTGGLVLYFLVCLAAVKALLFSSPARSLAALYSSILSRVVLTDLSVLLAHY